MIFPNHCFPPLSPVDPGDTALFCLAHRFELFEGRAADNQRSP